jgi:hypothetical protein
MVAGVLMVINSSPFLRPAAADEGIERYTCSRSNNERASDSFCATSDFTVAGSCLGSPTSTTLHRFLGVSEMRLLLLMPRVPAAVSSVACSSGLMPICSSCRERSTADRWCKTP